MSELYKKMTLKKNIYILPNDIHKNIDELIKEKLDNDLNGICIKEGYVKPFSNEILLRSEGTLKISNFKAVIYYTIKYNTMICNPIEGQLIDCIVSDVNVSIINCYIESEDSSPLNIFLSKQHHLGNSEYEKIKPGNQIKIKVLAKKFNYLDKQVFVIGEFMEFV